MEPGAVLAGDLGQVTQRVNRPGVGRAGGAHHRHRDHPVTLILSDRGPQRRHIDPLPGVTRNAPGSGTAQPEHGGGPLDGVMRLLGCIDPGPRPTWEAVLGHIHPTLLERPLPGRAQRDQVRRRPATGQHPLMGRWDAAQLRHPAQRHPLQRVERLHRIPLAAGGRRRQPRCHRSSRRPRGDEPAPPRLANPGPVRDDHLGQVRDDRRDPTAVLGQGHVQPGQPARPCACCLVTGVIPPELLDRRQDPLHRCRQLPQLSGIGALHRSGRERGKCAHHTPRPSRGNQPLLRQLSLPAAR